MKYMFMIRLFLMVFLMGIALPQAFSEDFYNITLLRVYDGDTFFVNIEGMPSIFGENIGVRVRGIDTPELRGSKCEEEKTKAYKARDYAASILNNASTINLIDVERDKYFRILASVSVDGVDLSTLLIEQGLAYEYDGGTKQSWCK